MSLFKKIQNDMYTAMKAGEKESTNTLRITLAKLKDKQIEKRGDLTEEEVIKIIQTLVKQRKESIELYVQGGRNELADIEKNEIALLKKYLPQMISENDIKNIVETVINEVGATSMSDMGKIMPEVMKRGKGLIDGRIAQKFVQESLG
ncbi:MAG: GatB/YqeY domain-containing protein [Candidatus Marinimicrobia bacterium]|nr:GatB/YqeY domain-containing protein [Candidatus Neomarinimicrobiota bacterium]